VNGAVWYSARAAGVVAYLLLSGGSILGMVMAARRPLPWPKFAVEEVHRFVTILTGVFLAIHVGAILVDTYVPFSLGQVLVPFTASYRPFATGLGVVALELLVAVAVTNVLRRQMPYRRWRQVHYAGFAVWAAATVHGLLAGTDRGDPWFVGLYCGTVAAVALSAASRFRVPATRDAAVTADAGRTARSPDPAALRRT
jgi:DMSO/TMAO reductase YedYZ heme-binding membrane subunit